MCIPIGTVRTIQKIRHLMRGSILYSKGRGKRHRDHSRSHLAVGTYSARCSRAVRAFGCYTMTKDDRMWGSRQQLRLEYSSAMSEPRRGYLAFLLRLWQVRSEAGPAWRVSLECARGGERLGFASLDELLAFLRQRIAEEEEMEDTTKDCTKQWPDSGIQ